MIKAVEKILLGCCSCSCYTYIFWTHHFYMKISTVAFVRLGCNSCYWLWYQPRSFL